MGHRILVVDDEAGIRDMTQLMLEKKGFDVITADNGKSALEKVRQELPDLILADVLMPEMDGYRFYKELKKDALTADIPVLIITARGGMEDSFKVVGADGFITKPVAPEELLVEIDHILTLAENRRKSSARPDRRPIRLLCVGTHPNVLGNMQLQAQRAGYEIATAACGAEAIAKTVRFTPDIIFVDISLSDISAGELINILKKFPAIELKPVIAYCYYSIDSLSDTEVRQHILRFEDDSAKVLACGASRYIGRYNHQIFIKTIIEALGPDEDKPFIA